MATISKIRDKKITIGARIDGLHNLREKKRALEAQVKTIEAAYAAEETALMTQMEAEGVDKSTGQLASVGISKSIVANIVDWDALTKYVKKTGYFHLFQRRVSDPAARELFELGKPVPGLEPFQRKKLTLSSLSK